MRASLNRLSHTLEEIVDLETKIDFLQEPIEKIKTTIEDASRLRDDTDPLIYQKIMMTYNSILGKLQEEEKVYRRDLQGIMGAERREE